MNKKDKEIINLDNIKHHIKQALQGHKCDYDFETGTFYCDACGRVTASAAFYVEHEENCDFLKQEESKDLLWRWANAE